MKEKILFFTDGWFLNFGTAKHLQEKIDYEFFAIMDFADKSRKFFEKQQLVKYQKVWYLRDYVGKSTEKPDIKYLESFEKKYKINLWGLAYTEREFYKYNKFYKFTAEEILSLLEQECKFFEHVLDEINPTFLSIFMTNNHYQELLCALCKAKGIKILMLGPARFGNRLMISEEGAVLDRNLITKNKTNFKTFEELRDYMKNFDTAKEMHEWIKLSFEEHSWQRYVSLLKFFFSRRTSNYSKYYANYGKTRLKTIKIKMENLLTKKYHSFFINRHLFRQIGDDKPFIYFPLHMEPERVLLIGAPFYSDQRAVITNIAKSIPVGYKLYVKEHPIMRILGWRDVSFYKDIMSLPNVLLLHPLVSHEELIKKSSLVITIAGTSGQEAAFYNKPAVLFTDQQYSHLPSVHMIKSIDEMPQAIKTSLSKQIDPSTLGEYIEMIKENTFEFNLKRFSADFAYRFGFKGLIMDAELPEKKVELFLKDHESAFEQLANEHIKKINQIRQSNLKSNSLE